MTPDTPKQGGAGNKMYVFRFRLDLLKLMILKTNSCSIDRYLQDGVLCFKK